MELYRLGFRTFLEGALCLVAALALGACARERASQEAATERPPALIQAGASTGSIEVKGVSRSFRLYIPNSLQASQPAALVIALHGGLGSPEQFRQSSRFDEAAEAHGFAAVYPEGIGRTWNGGRCCGQAAREDIDDVAFIAALIDYLSGQLDVDPARIFAAGHSNGGIMAFRLACELSEEIAAIVAVAGSLEIGSCTPTRPVAVLAIHGDADLNHPLEGGTGPNSIAGVPFNSLAYSMEALRTANACSAGTDTSREGAVTTTVWQGCRPGGDTSQKIIAGASHAWPGATRAGSLPAGEPTRALDATEEVWRFFEAHGREAQ